MISRRIYPLTFEPVFRDYIWGGRHLESLFGRQLPPGTVAESWEISGHPSSPTAVQAGLWRGRALPGVMAELGVDLVGRGSDAMLRRGRFPLLVKLLDANRDLSAQVHPNDTYARRHENGELGKTEMWYVLHAQPHAELIFGLARGVTPESLRYAIEQGEISSQLHRVPIEAGDSFFVPAGTVHALLAGAVVAEIQQNSDATYRVYDWDRLDDDGQPRPLHIRKALEVIDWDQIEPAKIIPRLLSEGEGVRRELLVDCAKFATERIVLESGATFHGDCAGESFEIWGCVAGSVEIEWAGDPIPCPAVRFALLPAALGPYRVRAKAAGTLLRVYAAP